jgi:hypothetical protein
MPIKPLVLSVPASALPIYRKHLKGQTFKEELVPQVARLTITPTEAGRRELEAAIQAARAEAAKATT